MRIIRLTLLSICLLLNACASRVGVTPGTVPSPVYPEAEKMKQAKNIANGFIREQGFARSRDAAAQQRAEKVSRKILTAAGYRASDFPVMVVDAGEQVNAMVLDGSSIIIYQELIDRTTEEELAVVLAHEVGHILGKHAEEHKEEVSRQESVSMLSSLLGAAASITASAAGYGGFSDTAGSLTEGVSGAVGYGVFVGSYSRAQEYEADHIGLMLLAKAGYDPQAAPRLWAKEEQIFGSSNSSAGAFFSTHPAGSDREEKLMEYMPLAEQYRRKR